MNGKISRRDAELAVYAAASRCIEKYRASPYSYLYETDLQAEMLFGLRSILKDTFSLHAGHLGEVELAYAYLEYPKYRKRGARLDIAVLDPERAPLALIEVGESPAHFLYNLPVWVGIEFKYFKVGDQWGIGDSHDDLSGLHTNLQLYPSEAAQNGLAIAFVQQDARVEDFCGSLPFEEVEKIETLWATYVVSQNNKIRKYAASWSTPVHET